MSLTGKDIGYGLLALAISTALGCKSSSNNSDFLPDDQPDNQVTLPTTVEVGKNINVNVDVQSPNLPQVFEIDVVIDSAYASISVLQGNRILLDQVDIPSSGEHSLRLITKLSNVETQTKDETPFTIAVRTGSVRVKTFTATPLEGVTLPEFTDSSDEIGLDTNVTYKYGGPSVGDIDGNGFYDAILNNHNYIAPQVMTNHSGNTVDIQALFPYAQDYHGTALGDYTGDGNLDLMLAMGGANGTSPSSYILFKNEGGNFVQVPNNGGINTPARGRSPRFVDLNNNGLLDLVLVNATTPNYDGPVQLFYKNNGDGTFDQVRVAGIESTQAERVLVLDFDNDGKQDLLLFSPTTLWKNNGDFTFTNVTEEWLPESARNLFQVQAAAEVDLNNNGLFDIYLSRGLPEYQMSRKSYDFNPASRRLDIRDDGETGRTLVEMTADIDAPITLHELDLVYRQYNDGYPIFLGNSKEKHWVYATGFQESQLHPDMKDAPHSLDISPVEANGFPEIRDENGIYIGYIGEGKWKAEWVRNQNVYWNVSFTLENVTSVNTEWSPTNRNNNDVLLINKGDRFVDATQEWNLPLGGNHWGVTYADFNNNGYNDLFIHRYGFLKERISDLLLVNTGNDYFETTTIHGAHDASDQGHGDMGQAFDFSRNGKVDLLNGSNEEGMWYLYENATTDVGNYINIDVGYSPFANIDPLGARVVLETASGTTPTHRVGSRGEVFSQSVMNLTHFGLGNYEQINKATVIWRNGETVSFVKPSLNGTLRTKDGLAPVPTAIELERSEKKLRIGDNYAVLPTFTPLNANPAVNYVSSDQSIASVDYNGIITAHLEGEVTITITSDKSPDVSAEIQVLVGNFSPIYVTGIEINDNNDPLYVGNNISLTTKLESSDPAEKPDDESVTWKTSNSNIATVDSQGVVYGVSAGQVDIVATANGSDVQGNITDSISLDVENYTDIQISLDNDWKYKTRANPIDQAMEVTFNYHASSNSKVPDGVKIYLRRLEQGSWALRQDYTGQGTGQQFDIVSETIGGVSGEITYSLNLPSYINDGLVPTSQLASDEFYYLFLEFINDKNESKSVGTQPICITPPGDKAPCS
ncbi:FG-GAP-like repeat-containing protein [Thaumasiovibrio sp. DFM-14]|uniref:FG-GAP-like repeat-containing protein n=1 Tax=Thaumasiovibrio sp. DFM-14 TaxID=3384792 RepID=UPI0039A189C6